MLREIIILSSRYSKVEVRTINTNRENGSNIQFKFTILSKTNKIYEEGKEKFRLISTIADKFNDTFDIQSLKNKFEDSYLVEVTYETKCSVSLFNAQSKDVENGYKLAVYDKDYSVLSRLSSLLSYSGIKVESIQNLQKLKDYDLVFVADFSNEHRDHLYLKDMGIRLCSIDREVNYVNLQSKKLRDNLEFVLSYTSKIHDYQKVVDSLERASGSFNIDSLLGNLSSKEKQRLVVIGDDYNQRDTISSILNASGKYDATNFHGNTNELHSFCSDKEIKVVIYCDSESENPSLSLGLSYYVIAITDKIELSFANKLISKSSKELILSLIHI